MFVYFKYLYVTFVSSCTTNKKISFAADIFVNPMPMLTIVILVPHRSDVSFTRVVVHDLLFWVLLSAVQNQIRNWRTLGTTKMEQTFG